MKIKRLLNLGSALVLSLSTLLSLGIPLANAATVNCTWTGAGSLDVNGNRLLSNDANWDLTLGTGNNCGGHAPSLLDTDNLIFPAGVTNKDVFNDLQHATFNSIAFSGTGDGTGYTFATDPGNYFVITGGISDSITAATPSDAAFNDIQSDIHVNGDQTFSVSDANETFLIDGSLSGSGNIAKAGNGAINFSGDNQGWTGGITASVGAVIASSTNAMGLAGAPGATINAGADFYITTCGTDLDFAGNLHLNGASRSTGSFPTPKLGVASGCLNAWPGQADENFGAIGDATLSVTLSGTVTLGSDITFAGTVGTTTASNLTGGNVTMLPGYIGKLVVGSTTSTSDQVTQTISDSNANSVDIFGNNVITIDGTRSGGVNVFDGGILKGVGTVGQLSVNAGGIVAPGHSPGCLNSGDLFMSGTYQAEIGGTTACTGYDQLVVTGGVDVTDGNLVPSLYGGFVPAVGQSFTIINNDGADAVTGAFTQGSTVTADGVTYSIAYNGGDGNDVVLTVTSVNGSQLPKSPNTGLKMITSNPLAVLAITVAAALSLGYISRRFKTTNR